METLESLSVRIATTGEIQSIVRTMKSLSAVSIRQYEMAVSALEDYRQTITLGLQAMLRLEGLQRLPGDKEDGRSAVIVFGSDRGLCGRFNEKVADLASERIALYKDEKGVAPLILAVGERAASRLRARGQTPDEVFILPGSVNGLVRTAYAILITVNQWREDEHVDQVRIFYNRRADYAHADPVEKMLVPISGAYLEELKEQPWPSRRLPLFTMQRDALFSALIRQHLFVDVYRAGAESLMSEHASRLSAMQAAERNIKERLDELSGQFRQKRQESITMELMDIVSGFEAMSETDAHSENYG